ncbi:MAG: tetratricopeptide repeat protein, partial [Planctomycetaceae bacterium]|nr:tetratricopeptide repeat protein [Planctomycetaceae bacterium]
RLGTIQVESGNAAGIGQIQALATLKKPGFGPAHLWLAQHAIGQRAIVKLTFDEIRQHLLWAVRQMPENVVARQLLASLYLNSNEPFLAEEQLLAAAKISPELALELAPVQIALNRSPDVIDVPLQRAEEVLEQRFAEDNSVPLARIRLANVFFLRGRQADALRLLSDGIRNQPEATELQTALSRMKVEQVRFRMRESVLNHDVCRQMVLEAIQLDPSNVAAIQQLDLLSMAETTVPQESIQPAIDFWMKALASEDDSMPKEGAPGAGNENQASDQNEILKRNARGCLVILLSQSGQFDEAVRMFEPMAMASETSRAIYSKLLRAAGQAEKASEVLSALQQEQWQRHEQDPDDAVTTVSLVTTLLSRGHELEALGILRKTAVGKDGGIPADLTLQRMYGKLCILLFDRGMADWQEAAEGSDAPTVAGFEDGTLLDPLIVAVQCSGTDTEAVDRFAKLAFSQHPLAEQAAQKLTEIRARGTGGAVVLGIIGLRALEAGRFEDSVRYLTQANNQTRGQNAQLLNNLAIAIVRSEDSDLDAALSTVDSALRILPDHPEILSTRAEIYVARREWAKALADLQVALPLRQSTPLVHRLLKEAYEAIGDEAMAKVHAARLAELEAVAP